MSDNDSSALPDALRNGPVFIGFFAVLAVVASTATVFVTGGSAQDLVGALGGGVASSFFIVLVYAAGRRYGQPHSHAVAGSAVVFGIVLLAAVIANLLRSSGVISDTEIALGLGSAVVGTVVIIGLIGLLDRATAA
jgi:hypothetical protein